MTCSGTTARETSHAAGVDGVADGAVQRIDALVRLCRTPQRVGGGRLPALLWFLGAVLLPTVLFTAVVQPLTPSRVARTSAGLIDELPVWSWLADLPWPVPSGTALALALFAVSGCAFLAYALAIVACWGRAPSRRALTAVLVPAAVLLTVSALALPTQSSDMIDYVLSGRVAAAHGASPYDVPPDAFPDDPLLPYASGTYTDDAEQKPPIWIAAAVGLAAVGGDDPAVVILVLRLTFLALTFLNLGLIAAVLQRWRPRHLLAGLVLYGWSPIIALHGQAKFDTLMATFALVAALLLVTRRSLGVIPVLWMSVLVKVLTLPLLATYVLGEASARRWRRLLAGTAISGLVTVIAYLPFGGSPTMIVEHLGLAERGGSSLPGIGRPFVVVAVAALVARVGFTSRGDPERLLQGWALVSLGLIMLTPIGWAWYLISPLAIVSLSGERWRTVTVVVLSALAFVTDLWLRSSGPRSNLPDPGVSRSVAYSLALVAIGALAVVLVLAYRRRSAPA